VAYSPELPNATISKFSTNHSRYSKDSTVTAKFQGAHPNNNFDKITTYLEIRKYNSSYGSDYTVYKTDAEPETTYEWKRHGISDSFITVKWKTDSDTPNGRYLIYIKGYWKNGIDGSLNFYSGNTDRFTVN
jgi:hypothetical protein